MSVNELLTLLGLFWPRLALYPGGLAAFGLIWLLSLIWSLPHKSPAKPAITRLLTARFSLSAGALVAPWLALALLPLPAAVPIGRRTDLVVVLALLEWPQLVAIVRGLSAARPLAWQAGTRRLAAALNSYPVVVLASLALAQAPGSLEVAALARLPAFGLPKSVLVLHWAGALAWLMALPLLLGLGPFRPAPRVAPLRWPSSPLQLGLWLRAIGLAALAALPWIAPFGGLEEQGSYSAAAIMAILLVPMAIGASLWALDRYASGMAARRLAWLYLALDGLLLVCFLWAAVSGLA